MTALPAEMRTVGMPVIENIPLPIDLNDAAMIVAAIIHRFFCRLVCINMEIAVADDHSPVLKAFRRMLLVA